MSDDYMTAITDGTPVPDPWGDSRFDLVEDSQGIRRFANGRIQGYIDEAIARRNPDKHVIAIAHGEATGEEKIGYVSLAVKINNQWSVSAAAYKRFGEERDWGVGGEVVWEG